MSRRHKNFKGDLRFGRPSIPACLEVRGFSGCGTFGAKTGTVPDKLDGHLQKNGSKVEGEKPGDCDVNKNVQRKKLAQNDKSCR